MTPECLVFDAIEPCFGSHGERCYSPELEQEFLEALTNPARCEETLRTYADAKFVKLIGTAEGADGKKKFDISSHIAGLYPNFPRGSYLEAVMRLSPGQALKCGR